MPAAGDADTSARDQLRALYRAGGVKAVIAAPIGAAIGLGVAMIDHVRPGSGDRVIEAIRGRFPRTQKPDIWIAPARLSELLRCAGHDQAADAAAAADGSVRLGRASREQIQNISAIRLRHLEEHGHDRSAADARLFLATLREHPGSHVRLGMVSDDDRHYLCVLTDDADRVLAVVVPPRGPGTPAPPIDMSGSRLGPYPLDDT